jgi:hypothetical protein
MWAPASVNLADYFTKHHSPAHHQLMHHYYLYINVRPSQINLTTEDLSVLRGCTDLPGIETRR